MARTHLWGSDTEPRTCQVCGKPAEVIDYDAEPRAYFVEGEGYCLQHATELGVMAEGRLFVVKGHEDEYEARYAALHPSLTLKTAKMGEQEFRIVSVDSDGTLHLEPAAQ